MEDYQKRMIVEYKELDIRTEKLEALLHYDDNAEKRKNICKGQLFAMEEQLVGMKIYRQALNTRMQMMGICYNAYDLKELKKSLEE